MNENTLLRIRAVTAIVIKNSKKIFASNVLLVLGLVPPLLFMYYAFGTAGRLSGNFEEKIGEVRSLGDSRIFFPLTYMYFVSISAALFISVDTDKKFLRKARRYLVFISKVAYDGVLFFIALMIGQAIYFIGLSISPIYCALSLFVIITSAVIAIVSGFERGSESHLSRFLVGLLILSASFALLNEVAEKIS